MLKEKVMVEYTAITKVAAVQAEPAWLDVEAGIDKSIGYIEEAARNGAELVAFPELFIPGYPWYIWLDSQFWVMQFQRRYHENSITVDGPHMQRLQKAAADNNITVVMGYSERGGGSLFMSQATIGPDGTLIKNRRKLKPTHVERSMFGEGNGSDLVVLDLPIGRVGALNCWEHFQTLTKYAMYSQHEQIHVASWPSLQMFKPEVHTFQIEVGDLATRMYAVEGQTFVVCSTSVVGVAAQELFCDTELKKQQMGIGGGWARIIGPDGKDLVEPLNEDEEGILYAELDLGAIALTKFAADPVGHYSRPDVLSLNFNTEPTPWVHGRSPIPAAPRQAAPTEDTRRPQFVLEDELEKTLQEGANRRENDNVTARN
jgi:aliphatic nitrilase